MIVQGSDELGRMSTASTSAPTSSSAPQPSSNAVLLDLLSATFMSYSEALATDATWESTKRRVLELEEQWHACGLCGHASIQVLTRLRAEIGWETMVPDQFFRFYRFIFHICKEPKKKHVKVETALAAWRLTLTGRFRLLDRWCDFVLSRGNTLRVINEDQWWQILDFSRTVHEDLGNFDPSGAWALLLDDFVEQLRAQNSATLRMHNSMDLEPSSSTSPDRGSNNVSFYQSGSKRRGPDVDLVAEQLSHMSAVPMASAGCGQHSAPLKKHCGEGGLAQAQPPREETTPAVVDSSMSCFAMPQELMLDLPAVQTVPRRVVRTRRSGVSELFNSTISDALGLFPI